MTITKRIIACFKESKDPLTTNDIATLLNEDREKIHVYIWRLKKSKNIVKAGKVSRENQYILNDTMFEKITKGYLMLNKLFENLVKDVTSDNLKTLLKDIDIELIKSLNSELIN